MRIDFAAVRERHPLAEVARRSGYSVGGDGGDVFVACPMPDHDDRTPSMLLHLDDGRYHCFGCGASGDVVQWVRDVYRVDAHEAVDLLESTQERFQPPRGLPAGGGEIRRQHRGEQPNLERTSAERVRGALAEAWRYYTLPRLAERASEYLADRGIDARGLAVMAGHTPYNPDQLVRYLRRRGFTDDELVDAGLAYRRAGEPVRDAYIRRVVVPVRDERGGLVGLIGRSAADEGRAPKYLNSATTVLYDKSRALFDPVRGDLAADGQVVVVEGVMDALAIAAAAHAAGAGEQFRPVATSGVAFSDGQIDRILALHPRAPVIALDGDPGGRRAAAQLVASMAHRGREATITSWPAGEDPASWLAKHGPRALSAITRAGCLEADPGILRPHHGGQEAATELMAAAAGTLEAKVSAALEPARKMPPAAGERYVVAAARAVAPVVVTAAASVPMENRGRIEKVIEAVTRYGAELPRGAEASYVKAAVQSIEAQELAPGMWAEREIRAGLHALRPLDEGSDDVAGRDAGGRSDRAEEQGLGGAPQRGVSEVDRAAARQRQPSPPQPRGVVAPAVPGPRKPPGGPARGESAGESARLARAGHREPPSAATRSARPGARPAGDPPSAVVRRTAGARRGR